MGFPGKSIDDLELAEDVGSDEETSEIDSSSADIGDEKTDDDDEDENDESDNADATIEGKYSFIITISEIIPHHVVFTNDFKHFRSNDVFMFKCKSNACDDRMNFVFYL